MRPGFRHKLINGLFEDPCLIVRPENERRSLLFDAGDIKRLSHAEIYRISDVFVTHTHIDHFTGFDSILRVILRRELPLNIYGPRNITSCVAGKLRGYAWNLIKDYPASINVYACGGGTVSHTLFRAGNRFRRERISDSVFDGTLLTTDGYRVRAVTLSHGIPCLAYALEEGFHVNIDKDRLLKKGLSVGPWLNDFKRLIREPGGAGKTLSIDGKTFTVPELSDIAVLTRGQKITYATDIALTAGNTIKLIELAKGSDVFYCEAYFLEKDRGRAVERFHLTARACGTIARQAGVRSLAVMHLSPRYSECPDLVIKEAMDAFQGKMDD